MNQNQSNWTIVFFVENSQCDHDFCYTQGKWKYNSNFLMDHSSDILFSLRLMTSKEYFVYATLSLL